jgi:threonine/homoserine/homoserine lactone efflux protein
MLLFLRGLIIGFSIAAPVGPIGVLCIRRTLAEGRLSGLASGLGAASADAVYGSIAAFGLSAISSLLVGGQVWLRLIGGLFLCYLGMRTFLAAPAERPVEGMPRGLAGAFASTFALTLSNPLTILSFAAIFAGLGASASGTGLPGAGGSDLFSPLLVVLGVFCGSALWWLLLSGGVSLLRWRFNPTALRWVNRISGIVIAAFGLVMLAGLLVARIH